MWLWPQAVAEHVRSGPTKKQRDARTVSVSGEARGCELRCRESVERDIEMLREIERERWICGDESCKLTIELSKL